MPSRLDTERLQDILDSAADLAEFIDGMGFGAFMDQLMVRKATLWQLTVIGEAAANLSKELRARCPQVEWVDISDFRNFVVHEYFGVDWTIVWYVATSEVPDLVPKIRAILNDLQR